MGYNLGAVKPHVRAAAEEIGSKFGIDVIYGVGMRPKNPNSDHPKGLALDFSIRNNSHATMQQVADYVHANWQRLGVTYQIWNRQIINYERGDKAWRPYNGYSPHTDHVHVSFNTTGGTGGAPVDTGGGSGDQAFGALGQAAAFLTDRNNWIRFGMFAAGLVLILLALTKISLRRVIPNA